MKIVILYNVRSAHNVGSIFRTADGAGVEKIYLTGYTPTPYDRFGRPVPEIKKTSLGASETLPWEQMEDVDRLLPFLRSNGVTLVAVEQSSHSIPINDFKVPEKVAYILGNEIEGVPENLLNQVDSVVEIPMRGQKESLNVSVCAGIVLFHQN